MKQDQSKLDINPDNLRECTFNDDKRYRYIDDKTLSQKTKIKIIEHMEKTNKMTNHF